MKNYLGPGGMAGTMPRQRTAGEAITQLHSARNEKVWHDPNQTKRRAQLTNPLGGYNRPAMVQLQLCGGVLHNPYKVPLSLLHTIVMK